MISRCLAILFIAILCFSNSKKIHANEIREVKKFDVAFYYPQDFKLKDLSFEIRVKGLNKQLQERLFSKKIKDVHYKVYWVYPGKFHVQVKGLPKGFFEIKNELKNLIKERLDFVIPQKMIPKLRSYSLKRKVIGNEVVVTGQDDTQVKAINEIKLTFDKSGKLKKFKTFSPSGNSESIFTMLVKSWSHNRWVLEEVVANSMLGVQKMQIKQKISYTNVDGFGFPERVLVTTTRELSSSINNEKQPSSSSIESEILFTNYQVNTGKPLGEIKKLINAKY